MLRLILHEIKIRIAQHKPFCAGCLKIYLDPSMRTLPLAVQDDAVAELAMSHALAQVYAEIGTRFHCREVSSRIR